MENFVPTNMDEFDKQLHDSVEVIVSGTLQYGGDVVAAIIVFIIGWWLAVFAEKFVARALSRIKNADTTLVNFISTAVRYGIMVVTIIAVLARFGVQTTSLIAVLGAAGLAIGLALQGTLSNVAAGVMLLLFRPYRIGHFVSVANGLSGTVRNLGLFTTELSMADHVQIIVPNNSIWGAAITNFSANPTRQMDIDIIIGYGDDADKVLSVMDKVVNAEKRVLHEKEPSFFIKTLNETSMTLTARFATKNSEFWATKFAVHKALKEAFLEEGIDIPPPARPIHIIEHEGENYPLVVKKPVKKTTKKASKKTVKKTTKKK